MHAEELHLRLAVGRRAREEETGGWKWQNVITRLKEAAGAEQEMSETV